MININHIFYTHHGLPHVDESQLQDCGCGGKPVIKFDFDYDKRKFTWGQVTCTKCAMTTGTRPEISEAIKVWQKCFEES